jgi:hypothetical protein
MAYGKMDKKMPPKAAAKDKKLKANVGAMSKSGPKSTDEIKTSRYKMDKSGYEMRKPGYEMGTGKMGTSKRTGRK